MVRQAHQTIHCEHPEPLWELAGWRSQRLKAPVSAGHDSTFWAVHRTQPRMLHEPAVASAISLPAC
jgi:hypothetical protein